MGFLSSPKRFSRPENHKSSVNTTPIGRIITKSFNKAIGTHVKKPSARKPQIHDRSFKPRDINAYLQSCKERCIEPSIDHDFDEFFDHAGGTSHLSQRHVTLPKRRPLLVSGDEGRIEGLPASPRRGSPFGRPGAKVAPYEAPSTASRYESGRDSVSAGPWIVRTRSHLRRLRKKRGSQTLPGAAGSATNKAYVRSASEGESTGIQGDGNEYSRVNEVVTRQGELYPVPPKLQKMRMRRKVGLGSISDTPEIGGDEKEDEDGEEGEAEEGGEEVKEEEEEELRSAPPARTEEDVADSRLESKPKPADGEEVEDAVGDAEEEEDGEDDTDGKFVDFVQGIWDNSDRASVGMKVTRMCFGFSTTSPTQKVISRPFFTVWVTIIQMIIYFAIIGLYGIAPIGIDWKDQEADVLMTDLTIQHQVFSERPNLWIGPREDDLIHLGAKFSPCIRTDKNIQAFLNKDRQLEAQSGCCVYNDGSGCVQSAKSDCSFISTWNQSTVCGEDPRYCLDPGINYLWPKTITEWPVCKNSTKPRPGSMDLHMTCQVVGRPCCIGVRGECVMATREYCSFRRGYFHENASLCSQVACLNDVCGMIRFTDPNKPDQFYRFFTSLCIHPGLLALFITMLLQWIVQYDLERYIGWWSMAVIYVACGYCGSILSAIFIPYYVEAGPSGSQFGVLAAMTVEIIRWNAEEKPRFQLIIIVVSLLVLFIIGIIVPQVDNWAHLAGFVIGLLLAVGFRPFHQFCGYEVPNYCVIVTRVLCFLWAATVAAILTVVFYLIDVSQCNGCMYFNCVPFTDTYCMGMGVNITSLSN